MSSRDSVIPVEYMLAVYNAVVRERVRDVEKLELSAIQPGLYDETWLTSTKQWQARVGGTRGLSETGHLFFNGRHHALDQVSIRNPHIQGGPY